MEKAEDIQFHPRNTTNGEFNAYQMWVKLYFSTVKISLFFFFTSD